MPKVELKVCELCGRSFLRAGNEVYCAPCAEVSASLPSGRRRRPALPGVVATIQGVADERPYSLKRVPALPIVKREDLPFYRKYAENALRRWFRLWLGHGGRGDSLLGREVFRGRVSHMNAGSAEDGSIFEADMEKLLRRLERRELHAVLLVGVQRYTKAEAAMCLGMSLSTLVRLYAKAMDRLSGWMLERGLLPVLGWAE